ncbi:hypothetical protein [Rhabdaerophilum sp. SD176]|uniref:hypothetical protein n=1 Tax=Rhabdaerophilum sp. SD176 TaxID=2983548 RepID=UPI0024DFC037|nr:hypothetical protein [Rhabdaerophilum sp. SD176]
MNDDPNSPSTPDPAELAADGEEGNEQPGSRLDILGNAVGDAVGEVCAAGLDLAGSILGGVLDGI